MNPVKINYLGARIASVILAIILWFFINTSAMNVQKKYITIQYDNLPSNLLFIEGPKKIAYYVKTNHSYSTDVKENIVVTASLEDSSSGWHTVPLKIEYKSPLPVYASLQLETTRVKVFLDKKMFKNLPIKADLNTENDEKDYNIKKIRILPEYTMIEGPFSIIKNLKLIKTQPIGIYRTGQYSRTVKLAIPSNNIKSSTSSVQIKFDVSSKIITKKISVPVEIINLNQNLTLVNPKDIAISLKVKGKPSAIEKLEYTTNIATLNLSYFTQAGNYKDVEISLNLPQNIEAIPLQKLLTSIELTSLEKDSPSQENLTYDTKDLDPEESTPSQEALNSNTSSSQEAFENENTQSKNTSEKIVTSSDMPNSKETPLKKMHDLSEKTIPSKTKENLDSEDNNSSFKKNGNDLDSASDVKEAFADTKEADDSQETS